MYLHSGNLSDHKGYKVSVYATARMNLEDIKVEEIQKAICYLLFRLQKQYRAVRAKKQRTLAAGRGRDEKDMK